MIARKRTIRIRRRVGFFLFVALAAFVLAAPAAAQMRISGGGRPPEIDSGRRAAIVDSVTSALLTAYIFEDVAVDMDAELHDKLRRGEYDDVSNLAEFTSVLTEDLRSVCHDRHLAVRYASDEFLEQIESDDDPDAAVQREFADQARRNFGFRRAEVMDGNVGYLKLDSFTDTSLSGPTAVAAMNFLAHCDALIIDLRDNGGGWPSLIQTMMTYLLDEQTHLNSFYVRESDSLQQFWSLPYVPGPSMSDVDLYVLTSSRTFSGAEEFTYNVKNLERGTIVGEVTGGGAHPVRLKVFPSLNVSMTVPYGRAINPVSGTNWEGSGVAPDIEVPRAQALDVAYLEALKRVRTRLEAEGEDTFVVEWAATGIEASMNPYEPDVDTLAAYAGDYGPRKLWLEGGALHYRRGDGAPRVLVPMSERLFKFEGSDDFRLEVIVDESGAPTSLIGHYSNGHTDETPRS